MVERDREKRVRAPGGQKQTLGLNNKNFSGGFEFFMKCVVTVNTLIHHTI